MPEKNVFRNLSDAESSLGRAREQIADPGWQADLTDAMVTVRAVHARLEQYQMLAAHPSLGRVEEAK